jgi:hypothetical protein
VRDRAGRETGAVRVRIDGELLLERVGGEAVPVDPGEHTFRFETAGEPSIDRRIIVRQGEKNRRVAIRFGRELTPPPEQSDARPIAAWVLGGVGVAAMATFAGFAIAGRMQEDELAACAPACSGAEADVMYDRYLAADIALGIGVATLVASGVFAIWYLSENDDAAPPRLALTF